MPAYVVSRVAPKDEAAFALYRERAAASIARHGGRYLVRGGPVTTLEGEATSAALVGVAFHDRAAAEAWYRSPDYARALAVRDQALERTLRLVDGVDPAD